MSCNGGRLLTSLKIAACGRSCAPFLSSSLNQCSSGCPVFSTSSLSEMMLRAPPVFVFSGFDADLIFFNDGFHKLVADHIGIVEFHNADAVYFFQEAQGLQESAGLPGGKIDLRDIAGDDELGVGAHPCQKHLHLAFSGVLGFIKNNKSVVEGSAPHKSKRGDLNCPVLEILVELVGRDHVV